MYILESFLERLWIGDLNGIPKWKTVLGRAVPSPPNTGWNWVSLLQPVCGAAKNQLCQGSGWQRACGRERCAHVRSSTLM